MAQLLRYGISLLLAILSPVFSLVFAIADEPKFVIVSPKPSSANLELGASLYRVLLGNGQRAKFEKAESIEEAIASKADVIVLAMPSSDVPPLDKETLDSLKKRKVVGIGHGAAVLFDALGLEINAGNCAHGTSQPPKLQISKNELLGGPKTDEDLLVLKESVAQNPTFAKDGERILEPFALFMPLNSAKESGIDVIARWADNSDYAPIARQGNYVLIGIASPATQWNKDFSQLVGETCMALHLRKADAFPVIRRELANPGKYEFEIAPGNSADKPFEKAFYFQFNKPTRLRAELEHSGSESVMLLFMGQTNERPLRQRQDAKKSENLSMSAEITADNITELGENYWRLTVTNFDRNNEAKCKLTITIEEL